MAGWIPATAGASAIDALVQAMLRADYVPAVTRDEFHARGTAEVVIRELHRLGYMVTPIDTKNAP